MKSRLAPAALSLFLMTGIAHVDSTIAADAPRSETPDGYALHAHHPVIDHWVEYTEVEGWIPVEVSGPDGAQWVGAVRARADTVIDLERRLVTLDGQRVVDVRFSDPDTPEVVLELARQAVGDTPRTVALDEMVQALAEDFEPPGQPRPDPGFNLRPPRIVVSETPLQLLLIDQEPVRAPIDGTELTVVVNTDWDLFHHEPSGLWYVINQGIWQTRSLLSGGAWDTTGELPDDFRVLAVGERWDGVRAALPPRVPVTPPVPFLVSLEPTELIVIDGAPRLQTVTGAPGLQVVANTERDLFELDGAWYFLAAGRWFTSGALDGDWGAVDTLPEAFSRIPPDHGHAHVRRAVPGTGEAAVAYIEATLPQRHAVTMGSAPGQAVSYVGEPRFEPIAGTRLERAVNTPFAVIRHNNRYYLAQDAAWYGSGSPTGPWKATPDVPEAIYDIPPSDPLYPVTYLHVADGAAGDEARFSYTEGYNGMYTIGRRAVRGTGYRYRPWIGYPPGGPVYWGYPFTYGGPWGYWGVPPYWAGYAPMQTLEVDGPTRSLGGPGDVPEQDPATARRGYDYTTIDQQRAVRAAGADRAAQDLYAAPDGAVYRRGEDGWSRHEDGEWDTMGELQRQYGVESPGVGQPESRQRQAYRQNPQDIERMERYYQRRANSYNLYSEVWVPR